VQPSVAAGFPAPAAVNAAGPVGTAIAGAWGGLPYSVAFGCSQMAGVAAHVPLPGAAVVSSHAERNALIIAGQNGLVLYPVAGGGQGVMYVQLAPCPHCFNWLGGGGGGVANPYAGAIGGGFTLNVWYRWNYPGGVGAMMAWNAASRAAKLNDINTNW
jgi:hypothetical protein